MTNLDTFEKHPLSEVLNAFKIKVILRRHRLREPEFLSHRKTGDRKWRERKK